MDSKLTQFIKGEAEHSTPDVWENVRQTQTGRLPYTVENVTYRRGGGMRHVLVMAACVAVVACIGLAAPRFWEKQEKGAAPQVTHTFDLTVYAAGAPSAGNAAQSAGGENSVVLQPKTDVRLPGGKLLMQQLEDGKWRVSGYTGSGFRVIAENIRKIVYTSRNGSMLAPMLVSDGTPDTDEGVPIELEPKLGKVEDHGKRVTAYTKHGMVFWGPRLNSLPEFDTPASAYQALKDTVTVLSLIHI